MLCLALRTYDVPYIFCFHPGMLVDIVEDYKCLGVNVDKTRLDSNAESNLSCLLLCMGQIVKSVTH